ncbi:PAP2 family protein [Nakamurella silvestris]|nr:PAP2 family protein [Nakamurella silvestris]
MNVVRAPSSTFPWWVFVLAVLVLVGVGYVGVVRPLNRARAAGRSVSYRRRFDRSAIRVPAAVGAGLLLALVLIAVLAPTGSTPAVDTAVHDAFVNLRTGTLTTVALVLTNVGSPFGSATLLLLLAAYLARRTASWTPPLILLVGPLVTGAINTAIKYSFRRERPSLTEQLVLTTDPSFPSGHVAWAVSTWGCIAVAMVWVYPDIRRSLLVPLCAIVPVLVALTRLYLGVHYLTDVTAAACLGLAATAFTVAGFRWAADRRARLGGPGDGPDDRGDGGGDGGPGGGIQSPATGHH